MKGLDLENVLKLKLFRWKWKCKHNKGELYKHEISKLFALGEITRAVKVWLSMS